MLFRCERKIKKYFLGGAYLLKSHKQQMGHLHLKTWFRQMERRSTCMSAGRKTLAHLLLHPSALVFLMRFEESFSKDKPFHGRCWAVGRCMNVRVRNWNLTISLMKRWQMHRLSCLKEVNISAPTHWSKCRQDPITLETLTIEGILTRANIQTRAVFSM